MAEQGRHRAAGRQSQFIKSISREGGRLSVCPWLRAPPLASFLGLRSRSSFSFFLSWASGFFFVLPFIHSSYQPILVGNLAERSIRISTFEIVRLPDQEGRSRAKSCAALSLWSSQGKCSDGGNSPFCGGALLVAKEE